MFLPQNVQKLHQNFLISANSVVQIAAIAALEKADLLETLRGDGPLTVFAPTDAAFEKIPKADLEALLADKAKLRQVLLYHVVPGRVTAERVVTLSRAKTASGQTLAISSNKGKVRINDSLVEKTDIHASNGIIHVVDTVILPGQG